MRAIRVQQFGGPEVLKLEQVPDPKPGQGEVLIRVHAAGINPVETYIRSGWYPIKPNLPYIPGSDAAGVVKAAGPGVTEFAVGDRVFTGGSTSGVYAELAVSSVSEVYPLPKRVSFPQGAGIHTAYATAFWGLFYRAHSKPGDTVLVHGATGGVGLAGVQMARAAGMTVIGTGGTERGRRLVIEQGAHHVLDHHSSGYVEEIMAITNGQGVDVVLEMLANVNLAKDLSMMAKGGRIVVIGNRGKVEIDPRMTMSRGSAILGMSLFNATAREIANVHRALIAGLENGTLNPVVGKEIPLAEAASAHQAVMEPGAYGKIVLIP